MNLLLRVMLILVIVAMFSAAILQLFFPEQMGANSEYGMAGGWQREIAFWNLAILPILIAVLIRYDWFWLRVVLMSLIVGGLGFGTNHLIGFIHDSSKMTSLVGFIENYTFVALWIVGWTLEKKRLTRVDNLSSTRLRK